MNNEYILKLFCTILHYNKIKKHQEYAVRKITQFKEKVFGTRHLPNLRHNVLRKVNDVLI